MGEFLPMFRYHMRRNLGTVSTWLVAGFVVLLAGTQGVITAHMPEIVRALAGPESRAVLEASLPAPSWQQAYAGWLKNLTQTMSIAVIAVNALTHAAVIRNGDIPFILTRHVRRSHFLLSALVTSWVSMAVLGCVGAVIAWGGTAALFPGAPFPPIFFATAAWVLQMVIIQTGQLLAAIIKPGVGSPLLTGFAIYVLFLLGSMWERGARYSPLGLSGTVQGLALDAAGTSWLLPVATGAILAGVLAALANHQFNRAELA